MDAKKARLKIITGRLFKKWGVKFSLEMLGAFLLLSYINVRWTQSTKIDKDESDTKVIPIRTQKITKAEKKIVSAKEKPKAKEEVKKETKPKGKGLININEAV